MTEHQPYHSLGPWVYCPLCASPLSISDREELPRRFCARCDRVYYHNPVPAAGGVIVQDGRVLLVQRKFRPRVGEWTLPAGFMEYFETPELCATREVAEETGLATRIESIFGVYAGHDDPRFTALLVLYRMTVIGGKLTPGDDARAVRYYGAGEIPEDIAFLAHKTALIDLFGDSLRVSWAQPVRGSTRMTGKAGGE